MTKLTLDEAPSAGLRFTPASRALLGAAAAGFMGARLERGGGAGAPRCASSAPAPMEHVEACMGDEYSAGQAVGQLVFRATGAGVSRLASPILPSPPSPSPGRHPHPLTAHSHAWAHRAPRTDMPCILVPTSADHSMSAPASRAGTPPATSARSHTSHSSSAPVARSTPPAGGGRERRGHQAHSGGVECPRWEWRPWDVAHAVSPSSVATQSAARRARQRGPRSPLPSIQSQPPGPPLTLV